MNDTGKVFAAATEVQRFFQERNWRFCFIGGVAVQRWGSPRFTQDVDLTLMAELGEEALYADQILARFAGRLRNARQFAIERRVLLVKTSGGVAVDIAMGAFPFEEASISRATPWMIDDQYMLLTCSAEDLIIHKVFASRDRDWADVESVLIRRHGKLDLIQVRRELAPLLEMKEDVEAMIKFEAMVTTVDNRLRQ